MYRKIQKLLWIVLVLVPQILFAAAAATEKEAGAAAAGAGRPMAAAAAGAGAADEFSDASSTVSDDYMSATLEEAVGFCKSIAQDNTIWTQGMIAHWVGETLRSEDKAAEYSKFLKFLRDSLAEWNKLLERLGHVLIDATVLPDILNQSIQLRMQWKIALVNMEDTASKGATRAQWESYDTILTTLLPFSSDAYQAYYRDIGYDYQPTIGKGIGTSYGKVDGAFFEIRALNGVVLRLPFLCDIELVCKPASDPYEDREISTLRIVTDDAYKFFLPLNLLPSSKIEQYAEGYYKAKREYEAACRKEEERQKKFAAQKASKAARDKGTGSLKGALAVVGAGTAFVDDEALLAALGDTSAPRKPKRKDGKLGAGAAGPSAAAPLATVVELPAAGGAGGSAMGSAGGAGAASVPELRASEVAAASSAYVPEDIRRITLALAAKQGKASPMPERSYALATEALNPDHKIMLEDLVLRAVPARTYDWNNLVKLLENLGFKRVGKNFRGFDATGKRKQIGLHYLHNKDKTLNPALMKIMFEQLSAIGLGRVRLGELLGVPAPLLPWPWESSGHGHGHA